MGGKITNAELGAKLDGLTNLFHEKFDRNNADHTAITDHLKELNGQCAKNTKFRVEAKVVMGFIAAIVSFLSSALIGVLNHFL